MFAHKIHASWYSFLLTIAQNLLNSWCSTFSSIERLTTCCFSLESVQLFLLLSIFCEFNSNVCLRGDKKKKEKLSLIHLFSSLLFQNVEVSIQSSLLLHIKCITNTWRELMRGRKEWMRRRWPKFLIFFICYTIYISSIFRPPLLNIINNNSFVPSPSSSSLFSFSPHINRQQSLYKFCRRYISIVSVQWREEKRKVFISIIHFSPFISSTFSPSPTENGNFLFNLWFELCYT